MKKILLTTVALLSMASASVFGMYGWDSAWIDFLTHGNQFRARTDQLGFVLGNDTIKGTFGFRANRGFLGSLLQVNNAREGYDNNGSVSRQSESSHFGESKYFDATISAGIGYTSSAISVGVGYNFTYLDRMIQVHTPVLVLNALDNNLRIAFPIQVAAAKNYGLTTRMAKGEANNGATNDYLGVSIDPQIRYYTGFEPVSQIRLYVYYGMNKVTLDKNVANDLKDVSKTIQSFGFQFRLYGTYQVEDVTVSPFLKLTYRTALNNGFGKNYEEAMGAGSKDTTKFGVNDNVTSSSYWYQSVTAINALGNGDGFKNPYSLKIEAPVGLSASSDTVSLYLEPSLGFAITGNQNKNIKDIYALTYGVYGEIYVTPVKNLEWYFEAEIDGASKVADSSGRQTAITFNASTGITWYLPQL